jgi:hypothetical protein
VGYVPDDSDNVPRAIHGELTARERAGILEHRVAVTEGKLNEGARTFGAIRDDIVRSRGETLQTVKEEAQRLEHRLSQQVGAIETKITEIKNRPLALQLPAVIAIVLACLGPVATAAWFASEYPKRSEFEELRRENAALLTAQRLMERDIKGLADELRRVGALGK